MTLDTNLIPPYRLPAPPKTVPELKLVILSFLEISEVVATPLRRVNTRFGGTAKRFGTTIQAVLNEMMTEGLLVIKPIPALNRTFLFTADEWADTKERELTQGSVVWSRIEASLKDVK